MQPEANKQKWFYLLYVGVELGQSKRSIECELDVHGTMHREYISLNITNKMQRYTEWRGADWHISNGHG